VEYYNKYNRYLFNKPDNVEYYQIDKINYNTCTCDYFFECDFFDFKTTVIFDYIISFGVMGNSKFSEDEHESYLKKCYDLLRRNGILFLRINHDKNKVEDTTININFDIMSRTNIIHNGMNVTHYKLKKL
jgi:cyclopropane fatty-acyl-phospholipid synthase-like methyltransferase